jgi:hypothetical protein
VQKPLKHEGYDRSHGDSGATKGTNKQGHGKGNWGSDDFDELAKHHSAEQAAGLIDEKLNPAETEEQVQEQLGFDLEENAEDHKESNKDFKMEDKDFPALS